MATKHLKTGKVRFSYVHVWEPEAMDENQEKKYSVQLLIPKKDKKTVEAIKASIEAAKEAGKSKVGGKLPANLKIPLRDGDEERPDDPNMEGMYFINAKADTRHKPSVFDADLNPIDIIDRDEFYSGCYGRALISFYLYPKPSPGIACALIAVQKLEDGEALDGRVDAAAAFSEDDDLM